MSFDAYLRVFERQPRDLLDAEVAAGGRFGSEAELIDDADADYERDRHGAFRIRADECALVVVDLQRGFLDPDSPMLVPEALRQLPRVRRLVDACRELAVPIAFTAASYRPEHANDTAAYCQPIAAGMLREGSDDTRVVAELDPRESEAVISNKYSYNAFHDTELDDWLRARSVRTVIVCGTLTNFCCEATARGAFDRGYHVVFGSDVTATDSAPAHTATLRTLRRGYARILRSADIQRALQGDDHLHDAEAEANAPPDARRAPAPAG